MIEPVTPDHAVIDAALETIATAPEESVDGVWYCV
jgi:hypothetical protein